MSANARVDISYSGLMTMPGGSYKRVNLDGVVTIDGDLDCLELEMNGVFKGTGKLKSNTVSLNGVVTIGGSVEVGKMDMNGDLKIDADASIENLNAGGRLAVKGNLESEKLDIYGEMKVSGSCEAENFDLGGSFAVGEMLNAGEINVNMYGPSSAKEIGGGKITIRKGKKKLIGILATLFGPLIFGKIHLTVGSIEGDVINIEHTTVKIIRGGSVTIGDGCQVDLVEYRTDFKKSAGASVLKHVKV